MALLFHFNFEMESGFFVLQCIFVCFVILSVPYSISSLSLRFTRPFTTIILVMAVASMLKSGNKSDKIWLLNSKTILTVIKTTN